MKANNQKEKKNQLKSYAKFSGIAAQMCITIYLGSLLGGYLDSEFPNEGAYYYKGVTLFSVFLSMYLVISQVTKSTSDKDEKKDS